MNIETIPKMFWYLVGVSIFVVSVGFVAIAWRSATVSIEIAETKIQLSSIANETESVAKQLADENKQLKASLESLQSKLNELKAGGDISVSGGAELTIKPSELEWYFDKMPPLNDSSQRLSEILKSTKDVKSRLLAMKSE